MWQGKKAHADIPRYKHSTTCIDVFHAILRAILRTLRIPIPLPPVSPAFSIAGLGLNFGLPYRPSLGPPPIRDAKVAAERWVRALEEETGCVSISRAQASEGEASGIASSSGSVSRRVGETPARVLPDFAIGSYESFVRTLAKENEAKIGCVIIVSEEHDDVAEFKRWATPFQRQLLSTY